MILVKCNFFVISPGIEATFGSVVNHPFSLSINGERTLDTGEEFVLNNVIIHSIFTFKSDTYQTILSMALKFLASFRFCISRYNFLIMFFWD